MVRCTHRERAATKRLKRQVQKERRGAMRELHKDATFLDAERERVGISGIRVLGMGFAWRIWQHPPEPLPNGTLHGHVCHYRGMGPRRYTACRKQRPLTCACLCCPQERGAGKAERRTQRRAGFAMLEQLEADMKSGGQGGLWKKKHKK